MDACLGVGLPVCPGGYSPDGVHACSGPEVPTAPALLVTKRGPTQNTKMTATEAVVACQLPLIMLTTCPEVRALHKLLEKAKSTIVVFLQQQSSGYDVSAQEAYAYEPEAAQTVVSVLQAESPAMFEEIATYKCHSGYSLEGAPDGITLSSVIVTDISVIPTSEILSPASEWGVNITIVALVVMLRLCSSTHRSVLNPSAVPPTTRT